MEINDLESEITGRKPKKKRAKKDNVGDTPVLKVDEQPPHPAEQETVKNTDSLDPLMADLEETPLKEITVMQLDSMMADWAEERRVAEAAEHEAKKLKAIAANTGSKIQQILTETKRSSYPSSHGTAIVSKRFSAIFPKDSENNDKVFKYLREKIGVEAVKSLVSINSAKFNSLYKELMEAAIDEGASDFEMAGIEPPKMFEQIKLRKAK